MIDHLVCYKRSFKIQNTIFKKYLTLILIVILNHSVKENKPLSSIMLLTAEVSKTHSLTVSETLIAEWTATVNTELDHIGHNFKIHSWPHRRLFWLSSILRS